MAKYRCFIYGIVSNYADFVIASSEHEAREIYAKKRGCHPAHVGVVWASGK